MRRQIILCASILALTLVSSQARSGQINTLDPVIEAKIDALLSKMTLEEKVGQMTQPTREDPEDPDEQGDKLDDKTLENEIRKGRAGSFFNLATLERRNELQKIAVEESRLGIPLIFGADVIHGYRTVFPVPLAEAASWNLQMMEKTAAVSAKEARAMGVDWTFSPMVDIARDPRWGRIVEGAGEDP
ncbi:MAG: glycoside hydrolase family 3 N-terminal domain-containing protein, partial [Planctomycetota bacterium]